MELIEEKLLKLTKYYDRITYADVYLHKEHNEPMANSEIKVRLGIPGTDIIVSEKSHSFEKSLSRTLQLLKRQLRSRKD